MSDQFVKVKEREDLVRDKRSGAILSTSISDYEIAKRRKAVAQARAQSERARDNELIMLRAEVNELREIIHTFLKGKS